jgi:hypothetical protein
MSEQTNSKPTARLATLDELIQTTIPAFISPIPCRATLRHWFDDNNIPRIKSNPMAKRGGGNVYYSVPHVEKLFRSRMLPGKLQPA